MSADRLPLLDRALARLLRGAGAEFVVGDILERYAEDLGQGMALREARARLRRNLLASLGSVWRSGARRGGNRSLGALGRDLRIAFRGLARRPGFSLGVALTLALGIGATTTIFSVVDGVLLRPLDFEDPDRLVAVGTTFPGREWEEGAAHLQHLASASVLNYVDVAERARSFESLAAVEVMSVLLTDQGDGPEIVTAAAVTPGFFEILRTGPALGRSFLPEEYASGTDEVYMMSHGAWQRRFGGDPSIVGQPLDKAGLPALIIGILPEDFEPPEAIFAGEPDLWGPLQVDNARYVDRGRRSAFILGRLDEGVTLDAARAEATAIADGLARDFPEGNVYPDGSWFGLGVNELHAQTVGTSGRALWIFLGASGLLLLLSALNAATLLLARSLDRTREVGIRIALGASRRRVVRLLLTEAGLLALAGGAMGVGLAYAGVSAFLRYAPASIPRTHAVGVDARILAVAAIVSLGAGITAGLLPAARITAPAPWRRLKSAGRTVAQSGSRLRTGLVGGQLALAMLLLSGAGLLITSFVNIRSVQPGFDPDGLLSFEIPLKRPNAPPGEEMWQAWDLALTGLSSVPGLTAMAGTSNPPYQSPYSAPRLLLPGDPPDLWREGVAGYSITPGYLDAVGTRLLAGRNFDRSDRAHTEGVALVNETFVRAQLEGADPIGVVVDRVEGETRTPFRIVGVVEDVVQGRAEEGRRAAIYFPYTQAQWPFMQAVVRSDVPPETLVPALRRAVAEFSPMVPIRDVQTMEGRMARTRTTPRFQTLLIAVFALVGVLLAAMGLYGSLSHSVGRRRRELGVRMALGAARREVLLMVMKQGLRLSLAGLAVGVVAALFAGRVLSGFLFEVQPTDPLTLTGVAAILLLVAAGACLLPARRATTVDPASVLQAE